ncbi:vacuolar protein sorting-associated protein 37B [Cimex lectularius]|uniref:VPS37 C-terminal domain-containing protein n=1 Tax=Cimex lectularius TaxID=79782 RepID=A0A8I6RZF4_CIMLE|nr:vacuolar protein sorting-associated protein 37B [Cimex lectularius]
MYSMRNAGNINYETTLGLFSQLNTEELKEFLNNDSKLEDLIKDDKQYKDIEKEKEIIMVSNRSLAEFNLSKEPFMVSLKAQLQELNENCEVLYKSVENKYNEILNKQGTNQLDAKLSLLQTAAAEIEEESEKLSESFLNGDMELDDFLEQFISRRKIMHLHKVKSDKMAEIINQQNQIMNSTNNPISYSMPQNSYNGGIRYGY